VQGAKCRIVRYGVGPEAELRPAHLEPLGAAGTRVEVPGFPAFTLALLGRHQVANAMAALAVARELGLDPAAAVAALEAYRPAKARMQLAHARGATLLVDCYNANPESTRPRSRRSPSFLTPRAGRGAGRHARMGRRPPG
jgi:UDP-N-acetylmuramoyl-tripeptide--D-alanyl-D-alanine ligase